MVGLFTAEAAAQEIPIIPLPNNYEALNVEFTLDKNTQVITEDPQLNAVAGFFKNKVLENSGISITGKNNSGNKIVLALEKERTGDEESYSLEVNANEVRIQAADEAGAFYGIVSLLQLIENGKKENGKIFISGWKIDDKPLSKWRGFMLDESRHFFGKKVVKEILDQMARLKLNRFHWHLTDEPGWRIEIKKYPLLTLIGGIGNFDDDLAAAQYYTQEDIREIVAYAKERQIEVIPEIDMPGHATAANKAYPEFSGGGTDKHPDFTFNPGKEETYGYLTDILREIAVLFPSNKMHLGGDEVSFGIESWNKIPEVKKLMQNEKLKDLKAVEHYFLERMVDSSLALFDKVIGWDEIADASLPTENTIVFWWRHDQPKQLNKALEKGHEVVLMPRIPLYFDFVQDSIHQQGRRWGGAFSPLQKIYDFVKEDYIDRPKYAENVLGIQANLWTEQVKTTKRLEFMIYPRITALAEAAWTEKANRDYDNYLQRLEHFLSDYKKKGIYFFDPIRPRKNPEVIDL